MDLVRITTLPEYKECLLKFKTKLWNWSCGHCYFCCFCNVDGYGPEDIEIKWKEGPNPVKAYSDVQMAQFKLMGITFGNTTTGQNHGNVFF